MGISIIESGGPMWLKPLSDERMKALIAVDASGVDLPPELTAYLIHLEQSYHDMRDRGNREFLRSSWEARTAANPARDEPDNPTLRERGE